MMVMSCGGWSCVTCGLPGWVLDRAVPESRHLRRNIRAWGPVCRVAAAVDRRRKDHGAMGEFLKGVRRYLSPEKRVPRRRDFVGRMCVIRTGRVDKSFGQAEAPPQPRSAALIEARNQ